MTRGVARHPTPDIGKGPCGRRCRSLGQGLVEYGLMLALIALVSAVCLLFFGDQLSALLTFVQSQV